MIAGPPGCELFKPAGVPGPMLEQIVLSLDELEALRLADLEGLYQEQAAERMGISRQTFGRTVETARRKVAEALVRGKALRIEGGTIEMADMRTFQCSDCGHTWQVAYGTPRPGECPECKSANLHRQEGDRARGGRGPFGPGRGRHRHGCCRAASRGRGPAGPA